MSPPRHNKDQGLAKYEDGTWGVDAYIGGRRVRKKVGGKQAAREELARLKAQDAKGANVKPKAPGRWALIGPNFDPLRQAMATIEEQVAALRSQLATSRAREQAARSALARLIEAAAGNPDADALAVELVNAQQTLEQLYIDVE